MSHHKMQGQRAELRKSSTYRSKTRVCRTFCCTNCRISVSSTVEEGDISSRSKHSRTISTLAHYLVQERLDQMIKQSEEEQARRVMEARKRKQKMTDSSRVNSSRPRLLFVVAMEKSTNDPRQEFRRSMVEVILANKLKEVKDLRCLLKYYIAVNSEEHKGVILEAFYQVCSDVFFSCKCI